MWTLLVVNILLYYHVSASSIVQCGIYSAELIVLLPTDLVILDVWNCYLQVMTPDPECTTVDTPIVDALHTMHDGKFLHLPVVDRGTYMLRNYVLKWITSETLGFSLPVC